MLYIVMLLAGSIIGFLTVWVYYMVHNRISKKKYTVAFAERKEREKEPIVSSNIEEHSNLNWKI